MARPALASRLDVVVVGGGIVGLATAYRLLTTRPGLRVEVLEAAGDVGTEQSGRNSGVAHAGLYYMPGSDRARWCREGKAALEEYCAERGIPYERRGKLVVAVRADELPRLGGLAERARANGVTIEEISAGELREREPNVTGLAALWAPETANTDFAAVCRALAVDVAAGGGAITLNSPVAAIAEAVDEVAVATANGRRVTARVAVVCAGLQSDRLARASGIVGDGIRIVPFRGSWFVLDPARGPLVHSNIYPVPVPGLPFLGVHLTPRVDGQIWIGPNALLALARRGRHRWSVSPRDASDALTFPGLWRLGRVQARVAVDEFARDVSIAAAAREVRRYVPSITRHDLVRGPWGVRAQALRRDGTMVDDFALTATPRVVHVRNAPSPAATASLAIGDELRRLAEQRL